MTKSPIYISKGEMKQRSSLYFIDNGEYFKLTKDCELEKSDKEIISDIVLENANVFVNIKPTMKNVNNQVFIGDPAGRFVEDRYLSAFELGMDASCDAEYNLVEAVYKTALHIYNNGKIINDEK